MAAKIEELITGKGEQDSVNVEGLAVPVPALKNLKQQGYENLRVYRDSKTLSLWGKTVSACFTLEQIQEKAKTK
jgi:hypothetical protein